MEELTKFHVDWKKIVIVGLLVVLTGITSAGATWYVMDMAKDAELEVKNNEISTLETRVTQLEEEIQADEEETEEATEESATTDDSETATEADTDTETETPTAN